VSEISKGDVVQLKSGGPDMTVQALGDYTSSSDIDDGALCAWFDGPTLHTEVFDRSALIKKES
jgi:uncharacterized protein YodC (DUF2158 family)